MRSTIPASLIHRVFMSPPDGATSTKVSVGLCQNTPDVPCVEWPSITGMLPYSAMGSSISYSNTSKLYRRYGSLYPPAALGSVGFSASVVACSGIPYTCATPWKVMSVLTDVGPVFTRHTPGHA